MSKTKRALHRKARKREQLLLWTAELCRTHHQPVKRSTITVHSVLYLSFSLLVAYVFPWRAR